MPEETPDPPSRASAASMAPGQISFGGIILGAHSPYRWVQLDGWDDLPPLDSGDELRPSRHGAWGGTDLAQTRVITLAGRLLCRRGEVGGLAAALRSATRVLPGAGLRPLTINTWGETLLAWARPTQRIMSLAKGVRLGHLPFTLQWTCPDPRRYSPEEYTRTIAAPHRPEGGLPYPLAYPLDYGPDVTGGSGTLRNAGDVDTHPVLTITGPCVRPAVVNRATGYLLEFDLVLDDAETLVVDCDAGTVQLSGATDRLYTRTAASVPVELWTLPPGVSQLQYRPQSAGPGSVVVIRWRDAYL